MRRSRNAPMPIDQGPSERQAHNKVVVERTMHNRARLRIVDQMEIDRLLLERKINLDQHSAGEHLYREVAAAGYFPACKWSLDANIRGSVQNISDRRADALVKIGLGRVWLLAKAGPRTTAYLFGVILGERRVPDQYVPHLKAGLNAYQNFEVWWYGRDINQPIPALLADMPGRIRSHLPKSFC